MLPEQTTVTMQPTQGACTALVAAAEPRGLKERYRAVVTRIGEEPMLQIEQVGEFRFAYRNVKKKPGDPRPFLQVGDEVECRLTQSVPTKAVSVRVLQQAPTQYQHDPYTPLPPPPSLPVVVEADPSSLYDQLGGEEGIFAFMDEVCWERERERVSKELRMCHILLGRDVHPLV